MKLSLPAAVRESGAVSDSSHLDLAPRGPWTWPRNPLISTIQSAVWVTRPRPVSTISLTDQTTVGDIASFRNFRKGDIFTVRSLRSPRTVLYVYCTGTDYYCYML